MNIPQDFFDRVIRSPTPSQRLADREASALAVESARLALLEIIASTDCQQAKAIARKALGIAGQPILIDPGKEIA